MSDKNENLLESVELLEQKALQDYCNSLELLPAASCLLLPNSDLRIIYANKAFFHLLGCTKAEMQSKYGGRLSALTKEVLPLMRMCEKWDGKSVCIEQCFRLSSRIERWYLTEANILEIGDKQILICVLTDISERKQNEKYLVEYRDMMRRMGELTSNEMFRYNPEDRSAQVLSSGVLLGQVSGRDQVQFRGFMQALYAKEIVDDEMFECINKALEQAESQQTATVCEARLRAWDGRMRWVRVSIEPIQSGSGEARFLLGVLQDITQQKEASLKYLNESQCLHAMLSEKSAYAQVDVTTNRFFRLGGIWDLYNELIDKITYSSLIEQFINKVVHPEDRKHYLELMQTDNFISSLENGIDCLGCQFRRIVEQNKMMWMELTVHLFRDPNNHHVMALLAIENIDVRKKNELIAQRQKEDLPVGVYTLQSTENAIRNRILLLQKQGALMLIRVENFDEIGEQTDGRVRELAMRQLRQELGNFCRREDIAERIGRDEFLVFLPQVENRSELMRTTQMLCDPDAMVGEGEQALPLIYKVGVAMVEDVENYEELFLRADQALYQAEQEHRLFYCYDPQEHALEDPALEDLARRRAQRRVESLQMQGTGQISLDEQTSEFEYFLGEHGDMAYLVDPDNFDLIIGNTAFYDRLGLTREQCVGMKCYELMYKRATPCPFCTRANWSRDKFYLWRNFNENLEQEFLIKNKLVTWCGQEVLLAALVDISNDKSIVDSIENSAAESHNVISGIQRMMEAPDLSTALYSALETIGCFFRAESVQFWEIQPDKGSYCSAYWMSKASHVEDPNQEKVRHVVGNWISTRKWDQLVIFETPDAMLSESYEMYELMQTAKIQNERWIPMMDGQQLKGIVFVANINANFRNVSFMESFGVFVLAERKKRELVEALIYADSHDELTNLLSRTSYERFLSSYDSDKFSSVGVITTNLNDLKGVNRRQGFHMGDLFIQQFARMIQNSFADSQVFRLNGDEFLIVVTDIAWEMLRRRVDDIEEQVRQDGRFTAAFGFAWDNGEMEIAHLIEQASQSMQTNKRRYYDSSRSSASFERRNMLQDLLGSIERREYEVFLQPQMELETGRLTGAEALIRYRHKEAGLLLPAQFIETLERNDFIRYIDLFVFEEICRLQEKWKQMGKDAPRISLNFSRLTLLENTILQTVETIIEKYDVSRSKLEIEITESMTNMGKSILYQSAKDLYCAGYAIALDDFGTKYTNLAILSEFDFDMLKIDRGLVSALSKRKDNQIILKNVILMCRDLGIDVIAEGVETVEQERILKTLGCPYGQGYLYGRPMPIADFEQQFLARIPDLETETC